MILQRTLDPWLVVILAGILCQLMKFLLYSLANRSLSLRILVTTNGLPSLYAVTFGCLTTMTGMDRGFFSPLFSMTIILSGIILHDAIRLQGSVDRGGRTALLVAQRFEEGDGRYRWIQQLMPLLGDRRHRPLHILIGLALGVLIGLCWKPLPG